MEVLWAPWRMAYIGGPRPSGCIFCNARDTSDARGSLILQHEPALVMLNRFPYANGHLMVAPSRHTADFAAMPLDELHAVMEVVQQTAARMREVFHPDGMNIGINLGAAAGAGVADHLHWHLVPRWFGDTNFMATIADAKVMNEHLEATWEKLASVWG